MNVLITGAAGFLGSRLADWLLTHHPEVENILGIDDLSGGFMSNVPSNITDFLVSDIFKLDLNKIFNEFKPDFVFHFAAYAAEGLSPFIRCFNYQNNTVCTAKIINACIEHSVQRLIFTSSMAVYGSQDPPFDENLRPCPIDPYGIAKYACEMDIQIAGEQHGLDWCIIRPHNCYGEKQNIWDKYRNVLGIWMYQQLNNIPLTVFGNGSQTRAFSYIGDCLEPLWQSAIRPNCSKQIINLGGTQEYTILEALDILTDILNDPNISYSFLESRHEAKNAWSTYQKSIDLLNYEHRTDLYHGLTKMWEWAQRQPLRERYEWPNTEIKKGLYTYWQPLSIKEEEHKLTKTT